MKIRLFSLYSFVALLAILTILFRRSAAAEDITEFGPLPNNHLPHFITTGSDGALWFTEYSANSIGRITVNGALVEYPIPTAGGGPLGITAGRTARSGLQNLPAIESGGSLRAAFLANSQFGRPTAAHTRSSPGRTAISGSGKAGAARLAALP